MPEETREETTVVENAASADSNLQDISEALNYDPFSEEDAPVNPDGELEKTPEGGTDGQKETADGQKMQPASEVIENSENEVDPIEALKQAGAKEVAASSESTKDELLRQALAILNAQRGTKETERGESKASEAEKFDDYSNIVIPDAITNALESEDPAERKMGMQALVQGVGKTVHSRIVKAMAQQQVKNTPEDLSGKIKEVVSGYMQSQQVFQDFYGNHQEYNDPSLYPVVQRVAAQLAKEMNVSTYNVTFRKAIVAKLKQLGIGGAVKKEVTPAPSKFVGGNGAKPKVGMSNSEQMDIEDTIFG